MKQSQTNLLTRVIGERLADAGLAFPYVAAAAIACRGLADLNQAAFAESVGLDFDHIEQLERGVIPYRAVPDAITALWANNGLDPKAIRHTFKTSDDLIDHWETLGCPCCGAKFGLVRYDRHAHQTSFVIEVDLDVDARWDLAPSFTPLPIDVDSELLDDSFRGEESFRCLHCGQVDVIEELSYFYVQEPSNGEHNASPIVIAQDHQDALAVWKDAQSVTASDNALAAHGVRVGLIGAAPRQKQRGAVKWDLKPIDVIDLPEPTQ